MNENVDPGTGEIVQFAPQDFMQVLRALNFGDVAQKLTSDYNELLRETTRIGRAGSITLSITLKPVNKGGVTQMEIYPSVNVKLPKQDMGADVLYVGDKGLQREHPRQKEIEGLRAVEHDNRSSARIVDVEPRTARTA